jgi:hypothetical protein
MSNILPVIPITKSAVLAQAQDLVFGLQEGTINPLDLLKLRKCLEVLMDEIKPELNKYALLEAEKYGTQFEYDGIKIRVGESGTKYDFSGCGDKKYESICAQVDSWTEAKKNREAFLKSLKDFHTEIDEETGEAFRISPPVKTSTTTTFVSL